MAPLSVIDGPRKWVVCFVGPARRTVTSFCVFFCRHSKRQGGGDGGHSKCTARVLAHVFVLKVLCAHMCFGRIVLQGDIWSDRIALMKAKIVSLAFF